jgi:SAM-dependent methyltransferase
MTVTGFDVAAYKAGQERDWTATAEGWRQHYQVSERQWQQVSAGLLERARIRPGHRVLDIATGIGEPALAAAALAGPAGRVVGTDLSAGMIAIAAERARARGISNVRFEVADADAGQIPGGRFEPGFFSQSDPAVLRAALVSAGFRDVSVEPFDIAYEFDSGEQLADWQFAISAPVNALLAARPGRRAQARQAVADAARQYRHADGTIRFPPSENFYATGRNPG